MENGYHALSATSSLSFSLLRRRALKENRFDDASDEVIRKRLAVYERETRPVLDCYAPDRIAKVDATMTQIAVLSARCSATSRTVSRRVIGRTTGGPCGVVSGRAGANRADRGASTGAMLSRECEAGRVCLSELAVVDGGFRGTGASGPRILKPGF